MGVLPLKGGVLFLGSDPATGSEPWTSDGTVSGTALLRELEPGAHGVRSLGTLGDHALLATLGSSGASLWRSDGSLEGTTRLLRLPPGIDVYNGFLRAGTLAYFFQGDFLHDHSLWRTDETEEGTFGQPLPPLPITAGAPVGDSLFLVFLDYAYHFSLWRTSDDGQALVRLHDDVGFWVDGPQSLVGVGSTLFLSAHDVAHGQELWRSDGTPEGTGLLRDIAPGPDGSSPLPVAEMDGALLFVASDGVHGRELWRSDGTSEGTNLLRDVAAGPDGSAPSALAKVDGVLLFAASDGVHGGKLWRSDGTEAGTVLVQDIAPGASTVEPRRLHACRETACSSPPMTECMGESCGPAGERILTGNPSRALADLREEIEASISQGRPASSPSDRGGGGAGARGLPRARSATSASSAGRSRECAAVASPPPRQTPWRSLVVQDRAPGRGVLVSMAPRRRLPRADVDRGHGTCRSATVRAPDAVFAARSLTETSWSSRRSPCAATRSRHRSSSSSP